MTDATNSKNSVHLDTLGKRGFLLHEDNRQTGEGFGYSAGWLVFPFVELALAADLIPIFRNENVSQGNRERDYRCLDVASFLDFDQRYSRSEILENSKVITLNTMDMDRPRNDELTKILKEAVDNNVKEGEVLTISIVGPLQQQLGPVPSVVQWFRHQASHWRDDNAPLKITMHIRRGDTANRATGEASERWAFKYGLPIYEEILAGIENVVPGLLLCKIDVFTEDNFSSTEQKSLKEKWPSMEFHRGNPKSMLRDLREMGTADIFISGASYFSALAGYFMQPESVIVMGKPSCYPGYFPEHVKCGYKVFTVGDPQLTTALQQVLLRKFGDLSYKVGDRVRITGLTSDAGKALNGQEGDIVRFAYEKARYEVRLAGEKNTKALKSENLELIE